MKTENYNNAIGASNYQEFHKCFREGCSRCSLHRHEGNYPVLHRGNVESSIMLVGEAPGLREREQGKPFVGPAGELLNKIFSCIGMDTDKDLFITNIVYCRPVAQQESGRQNYTPKQEQIVRCKPFLGKATELINPKIIIACGLPALKTITGNDNIRMKDFEGRWYPHEDKNLFIMRHPASILHQARWPEQQKETKKKVWQYMQHFRDTYKEKI